MTNAIHRKRLPGLQRIVDKLCLLKVTVYNETGIFIHKLMFKHFDLINALGWTLWLPIHIKRLQGL